jgi:putative membrane protein
VVLWWAGQDTPGRTLVIYVCTFMCLAGIALTVSDRMALSRRRGDGVVGALAQSVPPLVALIALAIG